MDCQSAKDIMPAYLANAATLDEVAKIEAHLAVCQECRLHLGKMIDEPIETSIKPTRAPDSTSTATHSPVSTTSSIPVRNLEPEPITVAKERPIEKIKTKNMSDKLTVLDYGVLITGIMILSFLLFLFAKK